MMRVVSTRAFAQAAMKIFPMLTWGSLFLRFVRGDVLMPRGETPDASAPRQYDKLAARHAAAPASRITMWNPLDQFHLRACACVMAYMQRRQTSRYSA